MKPRYVVDEVRRRSRNRRGVLCFYWVASQDGRDEFAQGLREQSVNLPLCPVVVRMKGFVDPNAVAFDLLRVLDSARSELLDPRFVERIQTANCLDVVLIARRELELESSSSPHRVAELVSAVPVHIRDGDDHGPHMVDAYFRSARKNSMSGSSGA